MFAVQLKRAVSDAVVPKRAWPPRLLVLQPKPVKVARRAKAYRVRKHHQHLPLPVPKKTDEDRLLHQQVQPLLKPAPPVKRQGQPPPWKRKPPAQQGRKVVLRRPKVRKQRLYPQKRKLVYKLKDKPKWRFARHRQKTPVAHTETDLAGIPADFFASNIIRRHEKS